MARQSRTRHSNDNGRSNTAKPPLTHCKYHLSLLLLLSLADQNRIESHIASDCQFPVLAVVIAVEAAADHLQGHHTSLQTSVSSFTNGLLGTTPALPGLDRTIVIPPRRLHLTLGVMSLESSEDSNIAFDGQATSPRKTLSEALSLLSSLRPQLLELLCGARLKVPLHMMGIMPPDRGDPHKAHVLWLGPPHENEDAQRLHKVGGE